MEFNNYSQSSSKNLHSWGIAVLLIVTAIWGTSYPLIKGLVNNLSPSVIFATRFVIAALPFTPYLRFLNISLLRDGALLGLIIFASSTFQTFGLETTSANRAAFIASFNVIIVPLVGQILGRQVVLKTLLTAAIAIFGVGVMCWESGEIVVGDIWRYILSPLSKSGEGVGGGVTLYLITSVSAVFVFSRPVVKINVET
ncbi:MAG: EamA family transporter, partial [Dolichospermum sp.]